MGKKNITLLLLLLSALTFFSFAALLDPFLNIWDERFHALVAKNLMKHPLRPTLYDNPVITMEYDRWDRYTLWLHKQPLFLWQIALSFKLFGISEFTLRLPNVLLGVALVGATYRSAKQLFDEKVAYYASVLMITCNYILELIAGRQELDHNDFTFLVYISLSIWAWIEYTISGNRKWLLFIGIFSGCAILCKWLVGLLIYLGWAIYIFLESKLDLSKYKDLFIALLITICISLPWQILSFVWYPTEALNAYLFNAAHITEPLDGHVGTIWYYPDKFNEMYGKIASFLILPAIYFSFRHVNNKKIAISLSSMVLVVYLFFSLVATKMPSFTVITAMPIMISFGVLANECSNKLMNNLIKHQVKFILFTLIFVVFLIVKLDFKLLAKKHSTSYSTNIYSKELLKNRNNYKSLQLMPNSALFNVNDRHYIEAMFYTNAVAYNFIPSESQVNEAINKKYHIIVFKKKNDLLPTYLMDNKNVEIRPAFIQSNY
jgi:4-amino-4-deoxy-L-arabinose transferase